jgi:hypothetical protein
VSEGTLFVNWSDRPVAEALVYFMPKKPVPAFKYKENGGRSELIRGFRGSTRNRFFDGFCQFYKQCRDLDGVITLLSPVVKVYVRSKDGLISQIPLGVPIPLDKIHAVSCVGGEKSCYEGVKELSQDYFVGTGAKEGGALPLI